MNDSRDSTDVVSATHPLPPASLATDATAGESGGGGGGGGGGGPASPTMTTAMAATMIRRAHESEQSARAYATRISDQLRRDEEVFRERIEALGRRLDEIRHHHRPASSSSHEGGTMDDDDDDTDENRVVDLVVGGRSFPRVPVHVLRRHRRRITSSLKKCVRRQEHVLSALVAAAAHDDDDHRTAEPIVIDSIHADGFAVVLEWLQTGQFVLPSSDDIEATRARVRHALDYLCLDAPTTVSVPTGALVVLGGDLVAGSGITTDLRGGEHTIRHYISPLDREEQVGGPTAPWRMTRHSTGHYPPRFTAVPPNQDTWTTWRDGDAWTTSHDDRWLYVLKCRDPSLYSGRRPRPRLQRRGNHQSVVFRYPVWDADTEPVVELPAFPESWRRSVSVVPFRRGLWVLGGHDVDTEATVFLVGNADAFEADTDGAVAADASCRDVWEFDVSSSSWSRVVEARLPDGDDLVAASVRAVVLDERLYVIGTRTVSPRNPMTRRVESVVLSWNASVRQWDRRASMPEPRCQFSMAVRPRDQTLWVVGGCIIHSPPVTRVCVNTVVVYDPAADTWSCPESQPTIVEFPCRLGVMTCWNDRDQLVVAGGKRFSQHEDMVRVYDPRQMRWWDAGRLCIPRAGGALVRGVRLAEPWVTTAPPMPPPIRPVDEATTTTESRQTKKRRRRTLPAFITDPSPASTVTHHRLCSGRIERI